VGGLFLKEPWVEASWIVVPFFLALQKKEKKERIGNGTLK